MDLLMKIKKSYDQSQDIHSPGYHAPKKATEWRNAERWLKEFLGNDETEIAWKLKLQGKMVNEDFVGELLVSFATFYLNRQAVRCGKASQASQVKAIVMVVLQILRKKKDDFPSGQSLSYHTFGSLLLHSHNFSKFWDGQKNVVNPTVGVNPAYPRDRAKLGDGCSPSPSGLALRAFIHTAPFAASKVHSFDTW